MVRVLKTHTHTHGAQSADGFSDFREEAVGVRRLPRCLFDPMQGVCLIRCDPISLSFT